MSGALTWEELADDYKAQTGRSARIQPMDQIFDWAQRQTGKYRVDPVEGTIHRLGQNKS